MNDFLSNIELPEVPVTTQVEFGTNSLIKLAGTVFITTVLIVLAIVIIKRI